MQPKMSSNAKDSETKDKALEKNSGWVTSDDIKAGEKNAWPEFRIQTRIRKHGQEGTARTDVNGPAGKCTGD